MNPVLQIPAFLRWVGLAVALGLMIVACVAWWDSHNAGQQAIGYDKATAKYNQEKRQAAEEQRVRELANFRKNERADDARNELEQKLAVARADARTADNRLQLARADFDRRLDGATREAAIAAAHTAAELLGECSDRYRSVAAAADGHSADAEQCAAAWPE